MTRDDFENDLENLDSLDKFDFDDEDFDFSFDQDNVDLTKKDMKGRKPITQTVKEVKSYTAEDLKNKTIGEHSNLILEGILKDDARYAAQEIKNTTEEMKEKFLSQLEPLKRDTHELLLSIEKKMPKEGTIRNIFDYIKNKTKSDDEFNSYARTDEVEAMMNEMDYKLESAKEQVELDKINIATELDYKKSSITLLDSINTNIKLHTEYSKIFNKKSLELQHKQFLATKDLIGLLKANHNEDKKQREAIIKNTGLPEYVKIKTSEALGQSIKGRLAGKITDTLFQGENVLKLISENIMRNVGEKIDSIDATVNMASMTGDQLANSNKSAINATIGGLIGNAILKLGYKGLGKGLGYKNTNKIENFIQSLATDPSSLARNLISDNPQGFIGKTKNKILKTILDFTKTDNKFKNIDLETHGLKDQAIFDGETHRSINVIIPQLLSKIHNEITGIRTGNFNNENELRFDHDDLSFKTKSATKEKIRSTLKAEIDDRTDQSIKDLAYIIEDKLKPVNFKGKEKLIKELPSALLAYLSDYGKLSPTDLNKKEFLQYFEPSEQNLVAQTFTLFQKLLEQDPNRTVVYKNFTDSINAIKTSPAQLNKYSSGMNSDLLLEDEYYAVDKYTGRVNADTAALRTKMKKRSGRKEHQVDNSLDSFNKFDDEADKINIFGGTDIFGETHESDIMKDIRSFKQFVKNGFKSEQPKTEANKDIFSMETDHKGNIVKNMNGIDFVINTEKLHNLNKDKEENLNYSFISEIIYNHEIEELYNKYTTEKDPKKKEEYFKELKNKIGDIEKNFIRESNKKGLKGKFIKTRNKYISKFGDKEYKENSKLDYYMSEIKKGKTLKDIFNTSELSNEEILKEYNIDQSEEFNSFKKEEYRQPEEPKVDIKKAVKKSAPRKKKKSKSKNKTKTISSTSDDEPSDEEFNKIVNEEQKDTFNKTKDDIPETQLETQVKQEEIKTNVNEVKEEFNNIKIKEDEIKDNLNTKKETPDEKIDLYSKLKKESEKINKSDSIVKYLGIISEDEYEKRFSKSDAEKIKKALKASPKEINEFIKKKYKAEIDNGLDYSYAKLVYLESMLKNIKEIPIEEHKKNIKEEFNKFKTKGKKELDELKNKYFKKSTPEQEKDKLGEEILDDRINNIKDDVTNQQDDKEAFNNIKIKAENLKKINKEDLEKRLKDIKDTFNKTKDDISDTIKDSVNGLKGKFIDEYVNDVSELAKKKEQEEEKKSKTDNPEGVVEKVFSLREKIKYMLDPANIVKHSIKGLINLPMHYKNFFFSDFAKNMRARERKMLKALFTKVPLGIGKFGWNITKRADKRVVEGVKSYKDFFTSDTAKKARKAERDALKTGAAKVATAPGKGAMKLGRGLLSAVPFVGKAITSPFKWARNKFKKGKIDDNTEQSEQSTEQTKETENDNKVKTPNKKLSKRQAKKQEKKQRVKQEKKSVVDIVNEKNQSVRQREAAKAEERERQIEKEEQQKNSWRNRLRELEEEKQAKEGKQADHVKADPKESLLSKIGKMLLMGFPLLLTGIKKLFSPLKSLVKPILGIGKTFLSVLWKPVKWLSKMLWKPIKWLSGMLGTGLKILGGKLITGLKGLGSTLLKFIPGLIKGAGNLAMDAGGGLLKAGKGIDSLLGKVPKIGKGLQWAYRGLVAGASVLGIKKAYDWVTGDKEESQPDGAQQQNQEFNSQVPEQNITQTPQIEQGQNYQGYNISKYTSINKDGDLMVNGGNYNTLDPNKTMMRDIDGETININTEDYRERVKRGKYANAMAVALVYSSETIRDLKYLKETGKLPSHDKKLRNKILADRIEKYASKFEYDTEKYTIEDMEKHTANYIKIKEQAENEIKKLLGQDINNFEKQDDEDLKSAIANKEEFNSELKNTAKKTIDDGDESSSTINPTTASVGGAALMAGGTMMMKNALANNASNAPDSEPATTTGGGVFDWLSNKAKSAWNKGKKLASETWNTAKTAVKDTVNVAKEGVKNKGFWGGMWDGAKAWGGKIVDGAKAVGNKAVELGTKYVNTVKEVGSKALNMASHLVPKHIKNIATKLISILKGFKGQILKRLGARAALKVIGTVGVKIASRLSPLGWGLLIYDAYLVYDYKFNQKKSWESAASLAILGFDLFDDDSVIKDEDGNPIKPDDPGMKDDPEALEEYLKQTAEFDKASEEQIKQEEKRLNAKYGAPDDEDDKNLTSDPDKDFNTEVEKEDQTVKAENTIKVGGLEDYFAKGNAYSNGTANTTSVSMNKQPSSILSNPNLNTPKPSAARISNNLENEGQLDKTKVDFSKREVVDSEDPKLRDSKYLNKYFNVTSEGDPYSGLSGWQKFIMINPEFKSQLLGFAKDYKAITGKRVQINSGYRPFAQQADLKRRYGSGAADPGVSNHQYTTAVDIQWSEDPKGKGFNNQEGIAKNIPKYLAKQLLDKWGLVRPLWPPDYKGTGKKEDWHVEPKWIQNKTFTNPLTKGKETIESFRRRFSKKSYGEKWSQYGLTDSNIQSKIEGVRTTGKLEVPNKVKAIDKKQEVANQKAMKEEVKEAELLDGATNVNPNDVNKANFNVNKYMAKKEEKAEKEEKQKNNVVASNTSTSTTPSVPATENKSTSIEPKVNNETVPDITTPEFNKNEGTKEANSISPEIKLNLPPIKPRDQVKIEDSYASTNNVNTDNIYTPNINKTESVSAFRSQEPVVNVTKTEDITNRNILHTQISSLDIDSKQLEAQMNIIDELKKINDNIVKLQPTIVDERIATRIQNQRQEEKAKGNIGNEPEKFVKNEPDRKLNRPLPGFNLKRNV